MEKGVQLRWDRGDTGGKEGVKGLRRWTHESESLPGRMERGNFPTYAARWC